MSIFDNKRFTALALIDLVKNEGQRIVSSQLATDADFRAVVAPVIGDAVKKTASCTDGPSLMIGILSDIHRKLSNIKLPGDFEKYAADEKFYLELDLPYKGEEFYDLSSLMKPVEVKTVDEEDCVECQKEKDEEKDEECESCDEDSEAQMTFADALNSHLEKIAYALGAQGNHKAAYLVERTMKAIADKAKTNKLF